MISKKMMNVNEKELYQLLTPTHVMHRISVLNQGHMGEEIMHGMTTMTMAQFRTTNTDGEREGVNMAGAHITKDGNMEFLPISEDKAMQTRYLVR